MKRKMRKGSEWEAKSAGPFTGGQPAVITKSNRKRERPAAGYASGAPGKGGRRPARATAPLDSLKGEDTLGESRAIARALIEFSQDALAVLDRYGTFLEVNRTVSRGFGLTRDALLGKSAWDFFPNLVTDQRKAALLEARRTSHIVRFEDHRNGRWFDHIIYPIGELDGLPDRFVIFARDITEQKRIEEVLRESEERYRLMVERTSDMVSITTLTVRPIYKYVSPSHSVVLGYPPQDLLGKSPYDFMHPEDRQRLMPVMRRIVRARSRGILLGAEGLTRERILSRMKDSQGKWHHLETTQDFLGDTHLLFVSREVSKRVEAERELQAVRKELEQQVEERTRELSLKTRSLEESNTALKVLLEMRARERKDLEKGVLCNVRQLAEPYLEKLRQSGLDDRQKFYVDIIVSGLKEIVSPLSKELLGNGVNLTPSQLRIANLIRLGKSSKEIAKTLNVSLKTVETHRRGIRAKLGVKKKKINLRSYLLQQSTP